MSKKSFRFLLLPLLLVFNTGYASSMAQQIIPANNTIPQANLTFAAAQVLDITAQKILLTVEHIILQNDTSARTQLGFNWNNNIP